MDQSPLLNSSKVVPKAQNIQDVTKFEVLCRVRPLQGTQSSTDIMINQEKPTITITEQAKNTSKEFTFNRIFKEDTTQGSFTQQLSDKIFDNCRINGKGSLVLSYGVTNSGKTFTILGTQDEPGLLPVLIERALREFPEQKMKVTAIQAYNDEFYSLENKMRLLPKELYGTYQFDDYQPEIITLQSIKETLQLYMKNRSHADTKANKNSSRSHAIFKIQCDSISIAIVDLAGSERLNKASTNVQETTSINTSLLVLGRCIHAFRDLNVVPYRESKLTKALAQYFNPLYKIFMVAHINRSGEMFHENVNVLEYAAVSMTVKHMNPLMNKSILKSARKKDLIAKGVLINSEAKNQCLQRTDQAKKKGKKVQITQDPLEKMLQDKFHQNKRKAMQIYLNRMIGSIEEFDYYLDYQFEKQNKKDEAFIQELRNAKYQSPKKEEKINQELAEAEERIKIRKQILAEIQMEKFNIQVDQCTEMGPSMRKCLEESIRRNPPLNNAETDDEEKEEEEEKKQPHTPEKENEDPIGQSVFQRIWTHSKSIIKSTSKTIIEKVVHSLRDLSKKKEKKEQMEKRKHILSFRFQEVNQKIDSKRSESQKRKSMNDFIQLLDKVDKSSVVSEEKTSFLLDSLNSTQDENGNKVHFNHQAKAPDILMEIRESEQFNDKITPAFFQHNQEINIKEELKKPEDKESTFQESATEVNSLQHHELNKNPKKIASLDVSSQQSLADNQDSKKSAASKSKGKKAMKFKYQPKQEFSSVKTRHQRNQKLNQKIA